MKKLSSLFMKAAVIYGLIGLVIGTYMGAKGDMAMMSVHSHINLIGWVSFAIFAAYYELTPGAAEKKLGMAHFIIANIGMIVMGVSLALKALGSQSYEAGAGIGSVLFLISFVLFAIIVFSAGCCSHREK